MEGFFDDFDDEFIDGDFEDDYDDDEDHEESDIEESVNDDPALEGDANEEEPEGDGFDAQNAFFVGSLFGFAYEEGRLREEKRKRKNADSDDSSVID